MKRKINKIGYACITLGINKKYKTLRLKDLNEERLIGVISHNLNLLEEVIDYNKANEIYLFRISSDIIPFASSKLNTLNWQELFSKKFNQIGRKIKEYNMRVSMHPGQYTVLNSNSEEVVEKSIDDLMYHASILDLMNLDYTNKLVLHIGGVYNDKEEAKKRFISNFNKLNNSIKKRLVIENDDKNYNIKDVLEISKTINIPVIYDNLHNELNKYDNHSDNYWIKKVNITWKKEDGIQKIHYSEQDKSKRKGSHSNTIDIELFRKFQSKISGKIDIMLEVKDKDISAIKCISELSNK